MSGLNASAIDQRHNGLPCRASSACDYVWHLSRTASLTMLLAAGGARDEHELHVHGYVHKRIEVPFSTYTARHRFKGK